MYVYPLRFMFGLMMRWIGGLTGLPLGARSLKLGGYADVNHLFAVYGVGFTAMCLMLVLLNAYPWRRRDDLALDAAERHVTRGEIGAWSILATVGSLSILLAFLLPARWVGGAGWAYMLLPVLMPRYGVLHERGKPVVAERVASSE